MSADYPYDHCSIFAAGKKELADEAHTSAVSALSKSIAALLHLEDLSERANKAFLVSDGRGGVHISKDIDPSSAKLAQMAQAAAKDKAEVTFPPFHCIHICNCQFQVGTRFVAKGSRQAAHSQRK